MHIHIIYTIIQRTSTPHVDIKYVMEKHQILLNIDFQIVESTLMYFDMNTPHVNVPIVEHHWQRMRYIMDNCISWIEIVFSISWQ